MKQLKIVALALAAGMFVTASPGAQTMKGTHMGAKMTSANQLSVTMAGQNGSKQDGSATITNKGSGIVVSVHLKNEPTGASEPMHIHQGTCAKLNPVPWKPLKNVVNGTSTTTVPGVTVAQLEKGPYVINAHKSANDLATYVSCGSATP